MKAIRYIIMCVIMLTVSLSTLAQHLKFEGDVMSITNQKLQLPVIMSNDVPIRGFQFDIELPEDFTPKVAAVGSTDHSLSINYVSGNTYRVLSYSMKNSSYPVNSGVVANITFAIPKSFAFGDYTISMSRAFLSDNDNKKISIDDSKITLSVVPTIALEIVSGWNWISSCIDKPLSMEEFFDNGAQRLMSQTQECINDPKYGVVGNLKSIVPCIGYKVNSSKDFTLSLYGPQYDLEAKPIILSEGWNWIGYPYHESHQIDEVISNAEEGDYICSQFGFAEYSDKEWHGSITNFIPCQGYLYKSVSDKTLQFDSSHSSAQSPVQNSFTDKTQAFSSSSYALHPILNPHKYPNTMNVTAQLYFNNEPVSDESYRIYAFCGDELRGESCNAGGTHYVTVYGERPVTIRFVAESVESGEMFPTNESLTFASDIIGNRKSPFAIHIGNATAIESFPNANSDIEVCNMSGIPVYKGDRDRMPRNLHGLYIVKQGNKAVKCRLSFD